MFLDEQTLLKIWLNPGLNYTESTEVKDSHTTPNELTLIPLGTYPIHYSTSTVPYKSIHGN